MRIGLIGTGGIARKHAQAYQNIGYEVVVCTNRSAAKGRSFAKATGAEFVDSVEQLCNHPQVDFVDVCTYPDFRLRAVELCARAGKHILVQKPIATTLDIAQRMVQTAAAAGVQLGVVSQHRFDDSIVFLKRAIAAGRLGRVLEADAYVKWHRTATYYEPAMKGSWSGEGGGALINQGIHAIDMLLFMVGGVEEVSAAWRLGAVHTIESEDIINGLLRFSSGALGVVQASTAFWPGAPERLEIHGTKGTAIITGDQLTEWSTMETGGEPAPLAVGAASGASDPAAISVVPFERQFLDFGNACRTGETPLSSGLDGYRALQVVLALYDACREGRRMRITPATLESLSV